ncbi:hypothetical protein M427DRAFT_143319 [Gonapodya prolifera JEL478]|uniref:Uncharacterized protein n=1 Tax=Gonapodya prolifera (strain JEL478) TaxID=1344416 RepID=A0A139AS63_GONPJ|nr:hypothetical protein M427DRAFT_143319 [Gonapodya prolifera JEL478]|eukprot:KXS19582.1 hypothetical protein M427DRAFT_143319 [Gonapodya prolifera JEL478]
MHPSLPLVDHELGAPVSVVADVYSTPSIESTMSPPPSPNKRPLEAGQEENDHSLHQKKRLKSAKVSSELESDGSRDFGGGGGAAQTTSQDAEEGEIEDDEERSPQEEGELERGADMDAESSGAGLPNGIEMGTSSQFPHPLWPFPFPPPPFGLYENSPAPAPVTKKKKKKRKEGKDSRQQSDSSPSYDGLAKQALPVADYAVEGEPEDGLEYLRLVRDQAFNLPNMFTSITPQNSSPNPNPAPNATTPANGFTDSSHPLIVQARRARATLSADAAISATTNAALLPEKGWQKRFLQWFSGLAGEVRRRRGEGPNKKSDVVVDSGLREGDDAGDHTLVDHDEASNRFAGDGEETGTVDMVDLQSTEDLADVEDVEEPEESEDVFYIGGIRVDLSGLRGQYDENFSDKNAEWEQNVDAEETIDPEALVETEAESLKDPSTGIGVWQPVPALQKHIFQAPLTIQAVPRRAEQQWRGDWRVVDPLGALVREGWDASGDDTVMDPDIPLESHHRDLENVTVPSFGDDNGWKKFIYGIGGWRREAREAKEREERKRLVHEDLGAEGDGAVEGGCLVQGAQDSSSVKPKEIPPYVALVSKINQRSTFHLIRLHGIWLHTTVSRSPHFPSCPSILFFSWTIALLANLDYSLLTASQWSVVRDLVRRVREMRKGLGGTGRAKKGGKEATESDEGEYDAEKQNQRLLLGKIMSMIVAIVAGWYGQADLGDPDADVDVPTPMHPVAVAALASSKVDTVVPVADISDEVPIAETNWEESGEGGEDDEFGVEEDEEN